MIKPITLIASFAVDRATTLFMFDTIENIDDMNEFKIDFLPSIKEEKNCFCHDVHFRVQPSLKEKVYT